MPALAKPRRNEACPCGSGLKFKRCGAAGRHAHGNHASGPESAHAAAQLAQDLLKENRFEEAIRALELAARLLPNNSAAFEDLGTTCLLAGRLPDAIGHLRRSIALNPGVARTHYKLGVALEQAGDGEGAMAALRKATRLAPQLAEAHALHGELLVGRDRWDEAGSAFGRAHAASPGTTLGRLCAAKALLLGDHPKEAETRLRELISRDGSSAEAHLMLGHFLSDAGRFDDAATTFERTLALDPRNAPAHYGLVMSRRMTQADRPLLVRITTRLAAADNSMHQRMTLHFAAGKVLDDFEDYAEAMIHFDAANRIRRQLSPFDARDFERQVDRVIDSFVPDFIDRHAALGTDDETPVLVLGMPRSGTTLIERILSSHPRVAGGGELRFWRDARRRLAEAEPSRLAQAAERVRGDYLRLLQNIGPDALRVTDKMPFNFLWLGLVRLLFPRARIIHCRRNPVDTCLSIYQTQFSQSWGFASDRGDLVRYYRQYLRLMDHWRTVISSDRLLEIDYEEVTADPETTARRLITFCGLEWDAACLQPERNPDTVRTASKWQARQPIYRSSVERWRRYEPWIGKLQELLSQTSCTR